jgi:hypothetical protein
MVAEAHDINKDTERLLLTMCSWQENAQGLAQLPKNFKNLQLQNTLYVLHVLHITQLLAT